MADPGQTRSASASRDASLPVPADDSLWPDQEEMTPPPAMESPDQQPEQLVPDSEAYLGTWTKSDLKLLAEYEVL